MAHGLRGVSHGESPRRWGTLVPALGLFTTRFPSIECRLILIHEPVTAQRQAKNNVMFLPMKGPPSATSTWRSWRFSPIYRTVVGSVDISASCLVLVVKRACTSLQHVQSIVGSLTQLVRARLCTPLPGRPKF